MIGDLLSCNFLEGIDSLIIKNHQNFGIPGSRNFKRNLTKKRKFYLNEWFTFFPGLHNPNGSFRFCDLLSYELECKNEFICLLLDINKSSLINKIELSFKLENYFDALCESKNQDIYSILLFLILLQNTKSIKPKLFCDFNNIKIPRLKSNLTENYFKSNISDEGIYDFVNSYPSYMFSRVYLPDISTSNTTVCTSSRNNESQSRFMSDLSNLSSIKCETFYSTSGYVSNNESLSDNAVVTTDKEQINVENFPVSYPYSSFTNLTKSTSDYWGEEFLEEWKAFEKGTELPRRFIWEDRGRNVGPEKPRLTEWRCPLSVGNGALCLVLYGARYNVDYTEQMANNLLNAYSVPVSSWIDDLIMLRLGIPTPTFLWNEEKSSFYLASSPPKYLVQQFEPHLKAGTIYSRLCRLVDGKLGFSKSIIRDGLMNRLRNVLSLYREIFTTLKNTFASVLEFSVILMSLTNQIEYLGDIFEVNPSIVESWPENIPNISAIKTGGIACLKYIYEISVDMIIQEYIYITFYLLEGCLQVVLDQLYEWLYKGQLIEELNLELTNDFILYSKEQYQNTRDNQWWQNQFVLSDVTLASNNVWLFDDLSKEILRCGKSIKLLSLIDDSHPFLYNAQIIKYRPLLQLSYVINETNNKNSAIIDKYVQVVQTIAADTLKSQKELIEEKRDKIKSKAAEAQRIREEFLKGKKEKLIQLKLEIHRQKSQELERLKIAAGLEKKRKLESIREEKLKDKELMMKSMETNRKIIEELKYDLTMLYAKKFADAEAREKLSLDRIKEFQTKLKDSEKSNSDDEEINSTIKEIIVNVIEDVQQNYLESELIVDENFYANSTNPDLRDINILYKDTNTQQSLYPEKIIGDKHLLNFQQINIHGHTADSTVECSLYPGSSKEYIDDQNHLNRFRDINTGNHGSESTAKELLYPGDNNIGKENLNVSPLMKSNSYGHQMELAPDKLHETNTKNLQSHTSDSTAQKSLYPDSFSPSQEEHFLQKENRTHIKTNTYGHTSDSTVQKSLYPNEEHMRSNKSSETNHIDHFKSINTKGHASQSSVQDLMYPLKKQLLCEQRNNNSIVQNSEHNDIEKFISLIPDSIANKSKCQQEQKNWLSVICRERNDITEQLKISYNHSTKLRNDSLEVTTFHSYNNDNFKQINRSMFPHDVNELSNETLIIDQDSIDALINRSLVATIMNQVKLTDSAIMFAILNTHKFRDHLKEIRKYLFLEDGKFSASLLPNLFEPVSKSDWTNNTVANRILLSDILRTSVNCQHYNTENMNDCLCNNINLISNSNYQVRFHNNNLDNFSMSYSIRWPLNIIIHHKQSIQYQSIFRAILQIKYSIWCLNETQQIIKSWNAKSKNSSEKFRPLYFCLQEMSHWVRSMDSSLGNQVTGSGAHSWRELVNRLNNGFISDIDCLIESHAIYLDGVVLRCVLAGDHTELVVIPNAIKKLRENIRKILIEMLGMCFTYYRLVTINYWLPDDYLQKNDNGNKKIIKTVSNLHKKFRNCGNCLLKIIKNVPEDSYLEHLSTCLDYNEFYYSHITV